jgi:hypothetical protein
MFAHKIETAILQATVGVDITQTDVERIVSAVLMVLETQPKKPRYAVFNMDKDKYPQEWRKWLITEPVRTYDADYRSARDASNQINDSRIISGNVERDGLTGLRAQVWMMTEDWTDVPNEDESAMPGAQETQSPDTRK